MSHSVRMWSACCRSTCLDANAGHHSEGWTKKSQRARDSALVASVAKDFGIRHIEQTLHVSMYDAVDAL